MVRHIFQREKKREKERARYGERERGEEGFYFLEKEVSHQRCELINTYVFLAMWRCTDKHTYIYIIK